MQAPALQIPKGLLSTKMHTQGHQLTEAMHLAAYRSDSGHQASRAGHAIPGYSAWHIPCSRNGLGSSAQGTSAALRQDNPSTCRVHPGVKLNEEDQWLLGGRGRPRPRRG